jgi:hypothetical protein
VRADHPNALTLDDRGETGEQPIIATPKQLREPRGPPYCAPVEPEIGQFGPRHRADNHHFRDRAFLERGEELADFTHPHPHVGVSLDRRIGRADDPDEKRVPSGASSLAGDLKRKGPPAGEDRQRRACPAVTWTAVRSTHPSSSLPARGTQIARSPP